MRLSRSLLRSALLLAAVAAAAGCDRDGDSVSGPARVPSAPNALIVPNGYSHVSVGGSSYACAIHAVDRSLVCWGNNDYGKAAPPAGRYLQVSAGLNHACARREEGTVVCWGSDAADQNVVPAGFFSQASAGNVYGCGVRPRDGGVACWGQNPAVATVAGSYVQVSAGLDHACALSTTGLLTCWGKNNWGQINVPDGVYSQVSAGEQYTCAVRTDATVKCWGSNFYGQSAVPAGFYKQVSAGALHTCALRTDNSIACWGHNWGGLLAAPAGAFTEVSANGDSACAVRTADNALVCWGYNTDGQSSPPGIGTTRITPAGRFSGPASVVALDSFTISLSSVYVPGHPEAKSFTYRFDCGDGKGYGLVTTLTYAKCPTRVAANRTVRGKVIDQDGDTTSYSYALPVKLRPQTVSFTTTAPTSAVFNTTYTVSAKTTSGLPVKVFPANGACTMSGNVVTFVGLSLCTIIADQTGDSTYAAARATQSVKTLYPFSGFFSPVWNAPTVNLMTAGRYVRIPFSLGGNRGANVVVSTATMRVTCDLNAPRVAVTTSLVATAGVAYDTTNPRYTLTWKADPTFAGSCRLITLTLADGTTHALQFAFN